MAGGEVRPFWLVLDIRSATSEYQSGLARFVIGLAQSLADCLATRRSSGTEDETHNVRLLLVAKTAPPTWAVQLVQEFPNIVSFWSGGPGALTDRWEKPQYLWSSRVLKQISRWSDGRLFWIAPCNFDRPILSRIFLPRSLRQSLVQVIHDTIPIDHRRSMSFLFWLQYSLLVKRTLAKIENVFTVSRHSAERLSQLSPRRAKPVHVLPSGVESIFGALPRYRSPAELSAARSALLKRLCEQSISLKTSSSVELPQAEIDKISQKRWVVGVGRAQKYKSWDVAEDVLRQINGDISEGVLFIRVGGLSDLSALKTQAPSRDGQTTVLFEQNEGLPVVRIESLSDELLAQMYRCSDAMLHPSRAEGFGFPPVEAALSGLPVIYRSGTAIDDHFRGHSFHPSYWQAIDSDDVDEWKNAVVSVLRNKSGLDSFFDEMHLAVHPRAFICQRGGGQDFRWERAAESLLNTLFTEKNSEPVVEGELIQ